MIEGTLNTHADEEKQSFTMRDFLAIGFRQRRLIINTFLGIVAVSAVTAFLLPKKYEAQMKILVRHERAEQVVSPERETPVQWRTEVSEEELQSEAELIRSKDLLGKVVVACNLQSLNTVPFWSKAEENDEQKIARAVIKLEKALTVQPIKLTNLISVSYKARDPQMAAKVLNSLASLYLEKHLAMHRAPGQYEFFYQQAEEYRKALKGAEEKLTSFSRDQGVVNPTLEKEMSVRKLAEFEAEKKAARAGAMSSLIRTYRAENEQLDRKELLQQDMLRTAKSNEENYMLYLRKAEEARISDALDRQRFSNVVVAEPATVPFTSQSRWLLVMILGVFLASLSSVILAVVADRWDPSLRTPEEVESFLGSPVVAAFPKNGD